MVLPNRRCLSCYTPFDWARGRECPNCGWECDNWADSYGEAMGWDARIPEQETGSENYSERLARVQCGLRSRRYSAP